jgi:hypothetical protein
VANGYLRRHARPPRPYGRFRRPLHPFACAQAAGRTEWIHEIKHDVYRLIVCAGTARPWDHDWTDRYPAIAAAAPPFRDECLPGFVPA